jgi:MFS family permease
MNVLQVLPSLIIAGRHMLNFPMPKISPPKAVSSPVVAGLLPIMAAVAIAFLVIGMALPVLPLHVHQDLGLGTFVVGLVAGSQFAASLLSRVWAGRFSDSRGAKNAVLAGLVMAVIGGLIYLLSLRFLAAPAISVGVLLAGRALLGAAESFIITGGVSWGLGLAGSSYAGRVIAWVGMAMFASLALGAPLGTTLYGRGGFVMVAAATALIPLATIFLVLPLRAVAPQLGRRAGLLSVAGAILLPGIGAALSSIGFGTMVAFSSLLMADRSWHPFWLLFSAFAAALVTARLFLGHLPDRLGGVRVALASVLIEAAGLAIIGLAPDRTIAAAGAAFTGLGFALVYPGLGVEAVRRAPPQSSGLVMGAYTACLDIALGFGSPALGFEAGRTGLAAVFLTAALIVLCAAGITLCLLPNYSERPLAATVCAQSRPRH